MFRYQSAAIRWWGVSKIVREENEEILFSLVSPHFLFPHQFFARALSECLEQAPVKILPFKLTPNIHLALPHAQHHKLNKAEDNLLFYSSTKKEILQAGNDKLHIYV